jgi:hypothetical protein
VERELDLIDPRVAKHFRESYARIAEPAAAAAPGKRRRVRSRQHLERELVANFEKWLKSLPAATAAASGGERPRAEGGTPSRSVP